MPGAEHNLAIGSDVWPGLAKLMEECGELQQVIGKIAAFPYDSDHPDGSNLQNRMMDEMGDVLAAIEYVQRENSKRLDWKRIKSRAKKKLERFQRWDREERARRAARH